MVFLKRLVLTVTAVSICFAKGCMFADPFISLLVSGDELEANLNKPGLVITDARTSGYGDGHIPGAINMLFNDPAYVDGMVKLRPVADLEVALSEAGLGREMVFVIYDDTNASFGAAGRIFWMLDYLGCRKVHVLNGTSLAIWELCSGEHTLLAMEAEVLKRFNAAEGDDVLADIADCVTTLQKEGLLLLEPR